MSQLLKDAIREGLEATLFGTDSDRSDDRIIDAVASRVEKLVGNPVQVTVLGVAGFETAQKDLVADDWRVEDGTLELFQADRKVASFAPRCWFGVVPKVVEP